MHLFLLLLFFAFSPLYCSAKEKICLNMIVKNESAVIQRCLDSVMPYIDYWVIVDTGSTDGTQKIIKNHLKNIPGELHERPWKNFGFNRSEAFTLAKGKADYILFMDADDYLEVNRGYSFGSLKADLYNMRRGTPAFSYMKPQLVKANLPWKWVGVTHEYLDCDKPYTSATLQEVKYVTASDGASSHDPNKFLKNIKLLEEGLKQEPTNARYAFYLAESCYDAGQKAKALECYQKRVEMGGWAEEVFWSKLRIANILWELDLPKEIVVEAYLNAHKYRPHRVEPIYYLCSIYNECGDYGKAYQCMKARALIPKPAAKDLLFNFDWMEEYGLLFQLAISAYYVGNYQESIDICDKLLKIKNLPEDWRKQAERNRAFPIAKLSEVSPSTSKR